MSDYVTLIGAKDVARAGNRIAGAADDMQRAALSFCEAAEHMIRAFDEAATRMQDAAERIERAMAGKEATRG